MENLISGSKSLGLESSLSAEVILIVEAIRTIEETALR